MKSAMGVIYTGDRDEQLGVLTSSRAVAAVPFCGRYRLIDFPLSSMTNSGIRNIGVIAQRNYNSLMDHLGSGKEWDLHGQRSGLVVLPPFMQEDGGPVNTGSYTGFLDAMRANLHYLRRSKEEYAVVTDTHMLFSARFDEMLEAHAASKSDITLLYTRDSKVRRDNKGRYIDVDANGSVTGLEVDPAKAHLPYTYMEAFCLRRDLLIDLVDRAYARGMHHFTRDLLMSGIYEKTLKIAGFEQQRRVWNIDSIQAYFDCNMELLSKDVRKGLFSSERPVLTKLRDEMPSRYLSGAQVKNSLTADGCVIEGTVENSILFRGVHVDKGAVVRNSIIMQDGIVQAGACLDHCILDKQVIIQKNTNLVGPATYPIVIPKKMTI